MSKSLYILIAIVAVVVVVILASRSSEPTTPAGEMMEKGIKVTLNAQNDSGESGTAELKEVDGKVNVEIYLSGAPDGSQPAHIHLGACPKPGAVEYQLAPVKNGESESTIQASLADLKSKLPLAVNVHKSADDLGTYVACGDINLDAMMEK